MLVTIAGIWHIAPASGLRGPLAKRRAVVTVKSLMRNAKSLFGKKLLPFIEQSITMPRPLPFDGVALEKKEPSLRYISKMDPIAILAKAKDCDRYEKKYKVKVVNPRRYHGMDSVVSRESLDPIPP